MIKEISGKVLGAYFFFVFLFAVIWSKAFYIQHIQRDKLVRYAQAQLYRKMKLSPKRGNIYDRHAGPLAINIQRYSLYTFPDEEKKQLKKYKALVKIVPTLKLQDLESKSKNRKKYTYLERNIDLTEEQVEKIKGIDGIYVLSRPSRYYPNHELFSQVLGYVGVDNFGLAGIEFKYDKMLQGSPEEISYLKDAKGRPLKFEGEFKELQADDLYLSIDRDIQAVSERILQEGMRKHQAERGGIGVLKVDTGEILAMANYPSYDPNSPELGPSASKRPSFITDPFEPGSTFKIFTVASALQNKIVSPSTHFFCDYGRLELQGHTITEAESHEKFEWLSVQDIIKLSSNVGSSKIAFEVGSPKLLQTLRDFNFNDKLSIEIPGESRGIFPKRDDLPPLELSNVSFGQGIAVTPLQLLVAYGAIANDGVLVRPTIFKRLGQEKIEKRRVLDKEVALELQEMLLMAVEKGTGGSAMIPYFQIAGKTGTAQRPSKSGGYKGYVSSFIGFPVGLSEKFAIFVYLDNPKGKEYYGGKVAAPLFRELAQFILYKNKSFDPLSLQAKLSNDPMEQIPRTVIRKENVSFLGLDRLSVKKLAKEKNLELIFEGEGLVTEERREEKKVFLTLGLPPQH